MAVPQLSGQSLLEFGRVHPIFSVFLVVPVLVYGINRLFFAVHYPANLPLVREPPGKKSFSFRTRLAYYTDCVSLYREAYENFSKKGKTVLIPGFGFRKEIILPHSAMRWVLAQPGEALSLEEAFADVDQAAYSLGHDKYITDSWQGMLVKTELNVVLENLVQGLADELQHAFDARFGTDTEEWKEINLFDTVRMIVAQAASRFTVGPPLCRNEEYLRDSLFVVDGCILTAAVAGGSPKILRPIIGPLVGFPTRCRIRKLETTFEPLYRERHRLVQDAKSQGWQGVEPQDHLQMMMRYAQKERPEEFNDLGMMTRRLCAANFGSMHQTSIQVTNMLLNVLGSDAEHNTISMLRDEIKTILKSDPDGPMWTKAKVGRMMRADSVARETLRLNSFGNRAIFRKVVREGVETPDGIRLPKDGMVSFLSHPMHTDDESYEDALKYDPFRFSRMREQAAPGTDGKAGGNLSFVSTSPRHLPFGHGRHACPGRFLIDFELKMILAYVLSNYDIKFPDEYKGHRPENHWVTEAILPPAGVKILIKRRE